MHMGDDQVLGALLAETEAGETVSGEVVHAILEGTPPLRAWRRHRGLTLDALAERTGVSKGYLSPDRKWPEAGDARSVPPACPRAGRND